MFAEKSCGKSRCKYPYAFRRFIEKYALGIRAFKDLEKFDRTSLKFIQAGIIASCDH